MCRGQQRGRSREGGAQLVLRSLCSKCRNPAACSLTHLFVVRAGRKQRCQAVIGVHLSHVRLHPAQAAHRAADTGCACCRCCWLLLLLLPHLRCQFWLWLVLLLLLLLLRCHGCSMLLLLLCPGFSHRLLERLRIRGGGLRVWLVWLLLLLRSSCVKVRSSLLHRIVQRAASALQ